MPKGKDQYQALPGADKLTWTDHLRASIQPDLLQTDERGATVNPKREFLRERIRVRQEEAAAEQKQQAAEMKKKLADEG